MATHVGDIFFDAKINRKEYDRGLKSMGASAGKFGASIGRKLAVGLAGVGFGKFIKDATKAGASLNAMGTIIDASLPHMTKQVDEFAKRAGAQFGLSETQAKGFVGKFASMASAMGYTEEQAYKMSTALTGLAGDVASYYHISQDEAFAKLGAVFTGETESLKQLGVIMTQNALDTFALQQGYGRTTAQMSELEKTTLRYNFVLDRLRLTAGDFSKYANTWSGSIATIKLNWANFMAVMGQGIINILLPLLQLIARISNALSALASRFLGWTKSLRGIKTNVQGAFGKKTQKDLKVADKGIGNIGSGLGGTGKSAKGAKKAVQALKRELLGFDKITKLTGEKGTASGGGTGGAGGAGGGGLGDLGLDDYDIGGTAQNYVDDFVKKFKEAWEKKDFTEIGSIIAEKLNSAMSSIPWDKIKKTLEGIAKSIGTFLNGFIGGFNWKLLATSLSKGIETAMDTASTLIETIDWSKIGKAVVSFIAGIDWTGIFKSSVRLVKAVAGGLGEALGGAVAELGKTIGSYITDQGVAGVAYTIGTKLVSGFVKLFTGAWFLEYIIKPFWDGLKSGFTGNTTGGNDVGGSIMTVLKQGLENKWTTVKEWFVGLPKRVSDSIGSLGTDVQVNLLAKWDELKGKAVDVVAKFTSWIKDSKFKNIIDGLTALFEKKDAVRGLLSSAWGAFTAMFTKKDNARGLLSSAWGAFTAHFEKKNNARGLLSGAWGAFTAHFEKKSAKRGLLSGAWGAFTAYFNKKKAKQGLLSGLWGAFTAHFTKKGKAKGGVYKNGKWSPIQKYAEGGNPTGGQMFIARERGAELVGTLRGHTAVMNNDQIVASVSAGVAKAISSIRFSMQAPPLASYSRPAQPQAQMEYAQVITLLQTLIGAVQSLDLDVQLDGESIKKNTVNRINQHTRSTGQLELII